MRTYSQWEHIHNENIFTMKTMLRIAVWTNMYLMRICSSTAAATTMTRSNNQCNKHRCYFCYANIDVQLYKQLERWSDGAKCIHWEFAYVQTSMYIRLYLCLYSQWCCSRRTNIDCKNNCFWGADIISNAFMNELAVVPTSMHYRKNPQLYKHRCSSCTNNLFNTFMNELAAVQQRCTIQSIMAPIKKPNATFVCTKIRSKYHPTDCFLFQLYKLRNDTHIDVQPIATFVCTNIRSKYHPTDCYLFQLYDLSDGTHINVQPNDACGDRWSLE
jgi:hypothetical protein